MNVNYNNLYGDYIGATGVYSISDYIDITSNTLATNSSNFTSGTSNILNSNIINLDNKYNNLIDQKTIIETYNSINYNVKHTYINNSNIDNVYSEIRFYSKNAINYPTYEITGSPIHKVKIGNDGKLYIWYSYNPFISLTLPSQWVDINQEIGRQQADGLNQGAAIVATENQIIIINSTLGALSGEITSLYALSSGGGVGLSGSPYNVPNLANGIITTATIDGIRNNLLIRGQTVQNYIANLGGATGFLAVIYGIVEGFSRTRYINTMLDQLNSNLNCNLASGNIANANIIRNTINYTSNNYLISNLRDVYDNYSNLGINQSFLNSNIQTQQYINNLKSNTITLNNKPITKFSLDNLDDWIKTPNGIYYDITNGTIAINSTPTAIDFFRVGGQTTIQGDFICEKKLKIDNTTIGLPTASTNGGTGDKLILRTGGTGVYPYSLGINTNNMWYSAPTGVSHNFYINGSPITAISSTGLSTTGTINASTNLQENAVNLSSKYLQLSGGIMSGDLSFNNRVQDFLIYLFSTNYGFGINSLALRYNVPFDASHKFYSGPTNTATIGPTGTITATTFSGSGASLTNIPFSSITSMPSYVLKAGDTMTGALNITNSTTDNQLIITNSSTTRYTSIKLNNGFTNGYIGIGGSALPGTSYYNNNLFIEANNSLIFQSGNQNTANIPRMIINTSGDVGIGTTNPLNKLYLSGGSTGKALVQFTQTTAWDNANPALSVSGYTNLGGFRINGADTGASLYQIAANTDMTFLQNGTNTTGGNIIFSVIGAGGNIIFKSSSTERMRIANNGNISCTGQITGITTLNATTGLFSTIATTNNANLAIPAVGAAGGTGDRVLLWTGSATVHPYSLGMNSSTLWYSVPNGASHIFYVNGSAIATISSTGVSNNGTNRSTGYAAVNGTYELMIGPPTATQASTIQTIQQGIGFNQKLTLQAIGGSVGIGTTNPLQILQVGDGARLRISNGASDYTLIGTKDVDDANNTRIVISGNTRASPYNGNIEYISTSGAHAFYTSAANERMRILNNGNIGIGTNNARCKLEIKGAVGINNGNSYPTANNYMQAGSLTIGDMTLNYGGGSDWSANTAGLMLECLDKTEIAVHDAGNKVQSLMFFEGGAGVNRITIGRNFSPWGAIANIVLNGIINISDELRNTYWKFTSQSDYCRLYNTAGTDYFNFAAKQLYASADLVVSTYATITSYITAARYFCSGDTLSYTVNWSGTAHSGWFYVLNGWWFPSGHAYLTVAIHAQNVAGSNAYCWFGRIFLSSYNNGTPPAPNGGAIQIITDYRNPASYIPNNNYITVTDIFDGTGTNALKITIANTVFAGSIRIKVYG